MYDDYKILTAKAFDDEGNPLPERQTGYDLIPQQEHDRLTAISVAEVWRTTPEEQLTTISASEFLRRLALVRAKSWSQATPAQMRANRRNNQERKRMRR